VRPKPLVTGLALAAALLGVGVPAGGSSTRPEARVSADRLLEKHTVPATGRIVTSRTTLKQGKRYRLVMTGTVTTTFADANGTVGSRFDALYCYASTVRLYRAGAPKKPQPPHGCPALRSSGASSVRAAASCHWVVIFRVSRTGPRFPFHGRDSSRPRPMAWGRCSSTPSQSRGEPRWDGAAGLVIHTDTYQSQLNPFLFEDGEIRLKPVTAVTPQNKLRVEIGSPHPL
jgi:hypothetical protein